MDWLNENRNEERERALRNLSTFIEKPFTKKPFTEKPFILHREIDQRSRNKKSETLAIVHEREYATLAGGSVANIIRGLSNGFGISSGIIGGVWGMMSKWLVLRYAILNLEVIQAAILLAKQEGLLVSLDLASFECVKLVLDLIDSEDKKRFDLICLSTTLGETRLSLPKPITVANHSSYRQPLFPSKVKHEKDADAVGEAGVLVCSEADADQGGRGGFGREAIMLDAR
ncbi:hypothetical protein JHK85_000607 [Glycine max]|nr:hypothetical protein JHK85_000607 [Glycine max]